MNRYEIETAKIEARTPLFYYPYSVELKSEFAKETLAYHFREKIKRGPMRSLTQHDLELVNEENMKELSGKYTFHYNDPKETTGVQMGIVRAGALNALGSSGIPAFSNLAKNIMNYGKSLTEKDDFEIIIGERVEIDQPVRITFDDIPDLMGINEVPNR